MLYLLPTTRGINIPSTIMGHIAPQIDPDATVLWGNEATAENARQAIQKLNPPYVFTTGHGIPCATTLQNVEPWVTLAVPEMNGKYCNENRNLDIWRGRVVHLHSCWCGRLLAPVLVEKYGAWAVFAHDHEFLFLLPEDGRTIDVRVAAPFLAEFKVDTVMLNGGTAGEAQEERMKGYDYWIKYFESGSGSKLKGAPLVLRILIADKMISKLYGDPTATVTKRGGGRTAKLSLPIEAEGGSKSDVAMLLPLAFVFLGGMGHGEKGHHSID